MEFRQLELFVAVAEELHFSRAAQRVGISQPPLTHQIRKLENQLGVALFDRTSRRVALTPCGELLLGHARDMLARRTEAISALGSAIAGRRNKIVIGFTPTAAYSLLLRMLHAFKQTCPDVVVSIEECEPHELGTKLATKAVDVGIVRLPFKLDDFHVETIAKEHFVVAMPSNHPLAAMRTLVIEDLAAQPILMFPRASSPGFYDQVISLFMDAGISPNIVQEARSWNAIATLVAAGIGLTLTPESAAEIAPIGIEFRRISKLRATCSIGLIHANPQLEPLASQFLAAAKKALRSSS